MGITKSEAQHYTMFTYLSKIFPKLNFFHHSDSIMKNRIQNSSYLKLQKKKNKTYQQYNFYLKKAENNIWNNGKYKPWKRRQ